MTPRPPAEMKTAEKGKIVFEEIQRELYHPPLFKRKVKAFEEKKSVLNPSPSRVEKRTLQSEPTPQFIKPWQEQKFYFPFMSPRLVAA